MKHFGLIGYPLGHSFSQKFFTQKFQQEGINAIYELYPLLQIEEFPNLCKQTCPTGLNVTIPYKETIIPYLHELDHTAAEIGAVNVIKFTHHNGLAHLKGFNTDVIGFMESIRPHLTQDHKKALIFGTGGASKAIEYGLKQLGVETQLVSRHKRVNTLTYSELTLDTYNDYQVLVNATPLGTYPNVNECIPIQFDNITEKHLLFDVVYNPEETLFLQQGRAHGAITINGIGMLHGQAKAAWAIWNS